MSQFIAFTAKPGFEAQINKAYAAITGKRADFLVYSEDVIEAEIAFIKSPEAAGAFSHVRSELETVEDWNRIFPDYKLGTGFVRVNARGKDNSEEVRRVGKFLIENRHLFEKVEGLDVLCSQGAMASANSRTKAA